MKNFKMKPFYCGECGSEILVDVIRQEDNMINVKKVLVINKENDYFHEFVGLGRYDLIQEIYKLRHENNILKSQDEKEKQSILSHLTRKAKSYSGTHNSVGQSTCVTYRL